jgi:hypothetical protein
MTELAAAQDAAEPVALTTAELVVAATGCTTAEAVEGAASALQAFCEHRAVRALLVHPDAAGGAQPAPTGLVQRLAAPLPILGRLPFTTASASELFVPLSRWTAACEAKAAIVLGGRDGFSVDGLEAMAVPVLGGRVDLVLPRYARHRLEGLINTGLVYPLTRALYGRRVEGQLGIDFGFSPRALAALGAMRIVTGHPRPLWLVTEATRHSLTMAQVSPGAWRPPAEPPADISTALAQVAGSVFEDMELNAAVWQRVRGVQPVQTFGRPPAHPDEPRDVDVAPMLESFRLGVRSLAEVWSRLLSPAVLVELNRLAAKPPESFRLADPLWARVVYDFALGFRTRAISRDHVVRALVPLYLAWVASFVLEAGPMSDAAARERIERLCTAFEAEKPYLVARWRWPDRFNS